jgi:required for meiotic nuclear division protein 1
MKAESTKFAVTMNAITTPFNQITIKAYQSAQAFNIKRLRAEFRAELHSGNTSELFYYFEKENRYLYIFDYGVVVFGNYDDIAKSEFLRFIQPYAENPLGNEVDISEQYQLNVAPEQLQPVVKNDYVIWKRTDPSVLKIVMLNTGQSVALEHYELLTEEMLSSTKNYIRQLEKTGSLNVSKTELLKYIGKVLNVKAEIMDNLYILDDPNLTWEDEALNYLNRQLKSNFDINARFKDLDYRLRNVEENLKLFTELLNNRDSSRMEIIIIVLILIEVLNIFFGKH